MSLQSVVDHFLSWETTQILLVQEVFEPIEPYLELISKITTARFMHIYFFPLILAFSIEHYINVMIVAVISHINIILLKWILAGTRPYWWVNETDFFTNLTRPHIRKSYLTCETTAGNPSGHAFNWCTDPFYIKPETTPFYSLAREFGLLFGLILCSPHATRFNIKLDIKWSLPAVISVTCLNRYVVSQIPRWNGPFVFHSAAFVSNFLLVLMLLKLVRRIAKKKETKLN